MILKTMLERSHFNNVNGLEDSITGFDFGMNGSATPQYYWQAFENHEAYGLESSLGAGLPTKSGFFEFFDSSEVQRAGLDLQDLARSGADRLANAVAVLRSPAQRLEDEHVQSSLEELDPILVTFPVGHTTRENAQLVAWAPV